RLEKLSLDFDNVMNRLELAFCNEDLVTRAFRDQPEIDED
ncbi:hypothetical protein AVEN_7166-1, partial [Araneus ventricosus]